MTTFYKVLDEDGTSPVVGHKWPLPEDGKPGRWVKATGPLALCENGVHLCDGERQLLNHLGPVIYEAEVRGERIDGDDKIAVREARLVRRVPRWNERTARLFACLCAERVLPAFESRFPEDDRPRRAIAVTRRFTEGEATREELTSAAYSAARSAARSADSAADSAERAWQADRLRDLLTAPGDWE